jgi:hypothetical protein
LVIPLAVLATVAAALQTSGGRHALANVGVIERQRPYVELAFDDPSALPDSIWSGTSTSLTFRIRRDAGTYTQSWSVSAALPNSTARVLATGSTPLSTTWTQVKRQVEVPCASVGKGRVRVSISAGPSTSIGFWTTCKSVKQ